MNEHEHHPSKRDETVEPERDLPLPDQSTATAGDGAIAGEESTGPADSSTSDTTNSDPASIPMGPLERAFFTGMIAAQQASEQIAELPGVKHGNSGPSPSNPDSLHGGLYGTVELAAFFWMMIGARMATALPALLDTGSQPTSPTGPADVTGHRAARRAQVEEAFLHGAMTRAPQWLEPAFQLTIPTFDVAPFMDRDGRRVGHEQLLGLITIAVQRTWGRISDGASEGPVGLDDPADSSWMQVGSFRVQDGW